MNNTVNNMRANQTITMSPWPFFSNYIDNMLMTKWLWRHPKLLHDRRLNFFIINNHIPIHHGKSNHPVLRAWLFESWTDYEVGTGNVWFYSGNQSYRFCMSHIAKSGGDSAPLKTKQPLLYTRRGNGEFRWTPVSANISRRTHSINVKFSVPA